MPNQNQAIVLNLDVEKVNVILGALGKLPYETVAPLINMIRQQAQAQLVEHQPPND